MYLLRAMHPKWSSFYISENPYLFKNASAFLLRDARHAMHDILLLRISAILPEAISDWGLTPTTDTDLLLATYRGGSHLTSDIQKALRTSSHAEPKILMISPGFIFRQEGTNELSAVFTA